MKNSYREIVHHSAVYGVAQIASKVASLLLLPLYTVYLRPADYGCIAIIDLTVGVLVLLIGPGIAGAVSRYHFEGRDQSDVDRVWWTGMTMVAIVATTMAIMAWLARGTLAGLTLGSSLSEGRYYYSLALPLFWFSLVAELPSAYLRVRKWSGLFLGISLARLVFNVGLNVYLLVGLRLGVAAILLGNLVTAGIVAVVLLALFVGCLGRYSFERQLMWRLVRFGCPLAITALLALAMHNADRYLVRMFLDMRQVGIYSLAYTIGQGVNTLFLLPFVSIWGVAIYEIAAQPEAKQVYARVFQYFSYAMMLLMLGVSLFSRPLLSLVATRDYGEAADLIPIVCLAYVFFSLHKHFEVPALLAKRTQSLLPAAVAATAINIGVNLVLIPRWGTAGAAWTSVLTFVAFAFVGLLCYRRIDRYEYPLVRCGAVLAGVVATYACYRMLEQSGLSQLWMMAVASVAWMGWAAFLFGPLARQLLQNPRLEPVLQLQA